MTRLERLHANHAAALLAFELENREYFAQLVPDRGDAYFTDFGERHQALLHEQDAGTIQFHVVVDEDGTIIGRVNLVDIEDGTADLGYRVAERAAGKGVATAAVAEVCALAVSSYGLSTLYAETTQDNPASMNVLERSGFERIEEVMFDQRPGVRFRLRLGSD